MSFPTMGRGALLGISGFPKVRFSVHQADDLEHVVNTTLSTANAFTRYAVIFCKDATKLLIK